ncbi:MAG: hypothetical protein E7528_07095 [Ruminococcaceae bacterium]|nr:hypothetical protein [Oscillospiraceae bacterium]
MLEFEYKGKIYARYNSKWCDKNYIVVPLYMQNELNKCYYDFVKNSCFNFAELVDIGDEFKKGDSYNWAIEIYLLANEKASKSEVSTVLPRITSCYRKMNKPKMAIDIFMIAINRHGMEYFTPFLLTSVAGAYCDLKKTKEARKCCQFACQKNNGQTNEMIENVLRRIETIEKNS